MIELYRGDKPNKKFYVVYKGKKIYFGSSDYQHYTEGHLDTERKRSYLSRAMGIKNKDGDLTYKNPFSSNFWAVYFLWYKKTYAQAKKYIEKVLGEKIELNF